MNKGMTGKQKKVSKREQQFDEVVNVYRHLTNMAVQRLCRSSLLLPFYSIQSPLPR